MNKKIKVCFFGAYDRNYSSNRLVLNGLKKNNIPVIEVNTDIKVTRLDKKGDMSGLNLLKRVLRKYKLIPQIIKKRNEIKRCDAIYVGYPGHFDVFPAFIVAKIFGKKLVFNPLVIFYTGFVEEQGILKKNSPLATIVKVGEKILYRLCDLIIADTPYQKDHLVKEFNVNPDKIQVVSIGADDGTYVNKERKPQKDEVNVVYYGLYAPIHSVETIIRAAKLTTDKRVKFLMIGNGNTYEKDFALAKSLKLKNMIFYNDMTEANALSTLQKADVFVGFFAKHGTVERVVPNKVFQGIALGKAVITAESKAIRSIFTDKKDIYLCKPEDPKSLYSAIKFLTENPLVREEIAREGYKLYKSRFTPKELGKQLAEYISVLN